MKTMEARHLKKSIDEMLGDRVSTVVQAVAFASDSAYVNVYEGVDQEAKGPPGDLLITYWEGDEYSINELCELL